MHFYCASFLKDGSFSPVLVRQMCPGISFSRRVQNALVSELVCSEAKCHFADRLLMYVPATDTTLALRTMSELLSVSDVSGSKQVRWLTSRVTRDLARSKDPTTLRANSPTSVPSVQRQGFFLCTF